MAPSPPPELLAAIAADPDADAPRLALAEWWEAHGQPERAELMRLQLQRDEPLALPWAFHDPRRERIETLQRQLQAQLALERPRIQGLDWWLHRGMPEHASVNDYSILEDQAEVIFGSGGVTRVILWSLRSGRKLFGAPWLGRIRELELTSVAPRAIDSSAIETLAANPNARALRSLALPASSHLTAHLETLARSPHLVGLRRLSVTRQSNPGLPPVLLARVPALPPRLRELKLVEISLHPEAMADLLARPEAPHLRSLTLRGCGLTGEHLQTLGDGSCLGNLQALNLADNPLGPEGVTRLTSASQMRWLRHLFLGGIGMGGPGLAALADPKRAAHLRSLEALGLSSNGLSDADLRDWLRSGPWPSLRWLGLGSNLIGNEGLWALGAGTDLPSLDDVDCQGLPALQEIRERVERRFREHEPPLSGPMPLSTRAEAPPAPVSRHADEDGLLQAILGAPHDPVPRLVYADWLEDQGESTRAALFRGDVTPQQAKAALPNVPEPWLAAVHTCRFIHGGLLGVTGYLRELSRKNFGAEGTAWLRRQRVTFFHLSGTTKHWSRVAEQPWLAVARVLHLDRGALARGGLAGLLASPHLERLLGLGLHHNGLGRTANLDLLLAAPLSQLCVLDLRENGLGAASLARLLGWPGIGRLRCLDLSLNPLGLAAAVLSAGRQLASLSVLDLSGTHLGPKGLQAFLEHEPLPALTGLRLSHNQLTDQSLLHLSQSALMPQLRELELANNASTFEGMMALARSPHRHPDCRVGFSTRHLSADQARQLREAFGEVSQ